LGLKICSRDARLLRAWKVQAQIQFV